jgi:predicted PhzF superfamily epimerase YddE/YHI9
MPVLQYVHLDVFTNQPFTGNQLAVFLDAEGIDERRMQRIANEVALPETTFVFPPEGPGTDARVRIFTPSQELPMAGSPTVGTTFALAGAGRLPSWRPQNANADSGHRRVGRNNCGACHPHRTARPACGSQYRFREGIAQIGPASVRHRRRGEGRRYRRCRS